MAETLNWRQIGPTSDLPGATAISAGDRLIIETADGYKYLDYATLLASQTVDLGDLGEGFGSGIGNLSLRHVPTDHVADGVTVAYGLVDADNVAYTPAPGDVVLAFVGGILDVSVSQSGSTVTFSDPPPTGERIRLCVFSPVAGTNTAALDDRYVQLLDPVADGYLLQGNAAGGLANAGVLASTVLVDGDVGVANGVAPLNASNVVSVSYLPAAALLGADGDAFAADHPTNTLGHPTATNTEAGFMSAADKTKLDNLPNSVNLNSGVIALNMGGNTYTGTVEVNTTVISAAPAEHTHPTTDIDGITDYAELDSPVFTGTPIAPNAAGGTNTNQIATTAFVQGEITTLNVGQYATNAYVASHYQPIDDTLQSVSALTGAGLLAVTDGANGAVALRTIVAGAGINVVNGDGVSGNITISAEGFPDYGATSTPVGYIRPLSTFAQANLTNVPETGSRFPPTVGMHAVMDLTNITAVDFTAVITTVGPAGSRIGPTFSLDSGVTRRDAQGNVVNVTTQPTDLANTTVAADAFGSVRGLFSIDATLQTNNVYVSFFGCNSAGGATNIVVPDVRVSATQITALEDFVTEAELTAALALKVNTSTLGAASGVATLDSNSKLPSAQLPAHAHVISDVTGLQAALDAKAGVREADVVRHSGTTGIGIGAASSVVIWEGTAAGTLTLTSNIAAKKLTISNRGSANLTLVPATGQSILGGNITLPPAATATTPSSVCIVRNPGPLLDYLQWVIV